jgi:hypothetical protein
MITTVGGMVPFVAGAPFILFNIQVPEDETWDILSIQVNNEPTCIKRVQLFMNTILKIDTCFANYCIPVVVNQRVYGGTILRMELSGSTNSVTWYGAFLLINRNKA